MAIIQNLPRAVIFDLDGTLMDTSGEIASAMARTFASLGLRPLEKGEVEAMIGKGVRVLVERALAKADASHLDTDATTVMFEMHYEATLGTDSPLYPGVTEGLERLCAAGVPMGVVTNKPRFFTDRLLEQAGVTRYLSAVVAGDDGHAKKPAPDMLLAACSTLATAPAATLMLGDSENDVAAARAAGCRVWCVPYGYNEGRPAESLACDRLVPDIGAAVELLLHR
ncbi:MAG: phosphoglycolate phosphatase [Vicinamibacterales bacterium]